LEGILVFHDQRVRNLMDMKIFVDTGFSSLLLLLWFVVHLLGSSSFSSAEVLLISFGVPSDADIRLARRIRRDTVERGRDISSVLDQVIHVFL
jgi:uridine kinase